MIKVYKDKKLYKKYPDLQISRLSHIEIIYSDLVKENKIQPSIDFLNKAKKSESMISALLRLNGFIINSF